MTAPRKPKKVLIQFALALFIAVLLGGGAVGLGLMLIGNINKKASVTSQEAQKKAEELESQLALLQRQAESAKDNESRSWQVVEAATEIEPGILITPSMLTTSKSKSYPVSGALRLTSQALGKMVRMPVSQGQTLTSSLLVDADVWLKVPPGQRAMSIKLDAEGGVNESLAPGARVDLLTTVVSQGNGGKASATTRTLLQNAPVIAVQMPPPVLRSVVTQQSRPNEQRSASITIVVTPKQAEMVTLASQVGVFQITLRNMNDGETQKTVGVDTMALLGQKPPAPPAKLVQKSAPAPSVPPPPKYSMKIIRGSGMETVDFQK